MHCRRRLSVKTKRPTARCKACIYLNMSNMSTVRIDVEPFVHPIPFAVWRIAGHRASDWCSIHILAYRQFRSMSGSNEARPPSARQLRGSYVSAQRLEYTMPFSVTIHGNADRINRRLVGTRSKKTSTALSLKPIFTGFEGPIALNWPAVVFSAQ
jgi:hypothetical protein